MIKKLHIIELLLTIVLQKHYTIAEIPLSQIRGLSTCMGQGYEPLAPAYGALYRYSSYLKNLYQFGDQKSPFVKFIKKIFNFREKTYLYYTDSYIKIALYLKPEDIGRIIAIIYTYQKTEDKNSTQLEENIENITKEVLQRDQRKIKETICSKLEQTIARNNVRANAIINGYKLTISLRDLIEAKNLKILIASLPTMPEKDKNELEKTILTLKRDLSSLQQEKQNETINNDLLLKDAGKIKNTKQVSLASLIKDCIQQEQAQLIPQWITIHTLLCFTWIKGENKDYFSPLFAAMAKELQIPIDKLYKESKTFFSKEEEKSLTTKTLEAIKTLSLEEIIYTLYSENSEWPPYIEYRIDTLYKGVAFSDCVETSLRNILNAIAYNPQTESFDQKILENLGASSAILEFYNKYKHKELLTIQNAHNDWAAILSSLESVNYRKTNEKCCIIANIQNFNKILNKLFKIESIDKLGEKLNSLGIKTLIKKNIDASGDFGTISFLITSLYGKQYSFDLEITGMHSSVQFNKIEQKKDYYEKYKKVCEDCLLNSEIKKTTPCFQNINLWFIAMFDSTFANNIIQDQSQLEEYESKFSLLEQNFTFYWAYLDPFDIKNLEVLIYKTIFFQSDEMKVNFLTNLYTSIQEIENPAIKEVQTTVFIEKLLARSDEALNIIDHINDPTGKIKKIAAQKIINELSINHNFKLYIDWLIRYIENQETTKQKYSLMAQFIKNKIEPDEESRKLAASIYKIALQMLQTTKDFEAALLLCKAFLSVSLSETDETLALLDPFYSWFFAQENKPFAEKVLKTYPDILNMPAPENIKSKEIYKSILKLIANTIGSLDHFTIAPWLQSFAKLEKTNDQEELKLIGLALINRLDSFKTPEEVTYLAKEISKISVPANKSLREFVELMYAWMTHCNITGPATISTIITNLRRTKNDAGQDGEKLIEHAYNWIVELVKNLDKVEIDKIREEAKQQPYKTKAQKSFQEKILAL